MNKAIFGLAESIESLRSELSEAMTASKSQGIQFVVEPIELTVQAAVTKDASGKIGWSVVGLGSSYKSGTTQTLKLRLAPVWKNTDGTLVGDFTVSDVQALAEPPDHVGPKPEARR
jgi:Trypsin-co-occurring domain 2